MSDPDSFSDETPLPKRQQRAEIEPLSNATTTNNNHQRGLSIGKDSPPTTFSKHNSTIRFIVMMSLVRNVGAVVAGLAVGSAVNMSLIVLNTTVLYPLPKGVSFDDTKAFGEYIKNLPLPAFLVVFAAHFGQALVGGYTAARLGGGNNDDKGGNNAMLLSQTVGAFTLLGAIMNNRSIPVPTWTWIEMPFFPVMAWIAGRAVENATNGSAKKN